MFNPLQQSGPRLGANLSKATSCKTLCLVDNQTRSTNCNRPYHSVGREFASGLEAAQLTG